MTLGIIDIDAAWFSDHPDRKARIRKVIGAESHSEFISLGSHDINRRFIVAIKIPETGRLLKIPFLAFADETISDDDATLLPIIDGLMREAAARYGIPTR